MMKDLQVVSINLFDSKDTYHIYIKRIFCSSKEVYKIGHQIHVFREAPETENI